MGPVLIRGDGEADILDEVNEDEAFGLEYVQKLLS